MIFFKISFHKYKRPVAIQKIVYRVFFVLFIPFHYVHALEGTQKIDSLQQELAIHNTADTLKVDLLNTLGYEYWIIDAKEAIRFGNKALRLSAQLEYQNGQAKANRVIGVAYWAQGNLNKALQYLHSAHKLYKNKTDRTGLANVRLNIGMVYADLKDYSKALQNYEQAINAFTALGLKSRIATTFTKIGTLLIEQHKDREALKYLTDALNMHMDNNFTYGIAEAHNKLGILYLYKNETEQASYHIQKSMILGGEINDIDGLAHNSILYGKTLRLSKHYDEAILHVNKGLELAKENGLKKYELLAYEELKELKKKQTQPQEAYAFYDKYISLRDSLFNLDKSKQIAYLEFEKELEKKDHKLFLFEQQKDKDRNIRLSLTLLIIILLICGSAIYFTYKQRAEKSKQLTIKTQELLEVAYALSQKKLENSKLKQQELKQQLNFKNKELSAYTLNFIKKNELVKELNKMIQEIKKSPSIDKGKLITKLHKIIRKNLTIDRDWEDFNRFFEDAYQGFYEQLKSKHIALSTNDLKICSLIRLNLNAKEMAGILGISPDSVRTARYRLRKKLQLSPQQEMYTYLLHLEQGGHKAIPS